MSRLRCIPPVRHGEIDRGSGICIHGATDVGLGGGGLEQTERAAREVGGERIDLPVALPLRRSWRGAWMVGGETPVLLERDFGKVPFGRWMGAAPRSGAA